MLNTHLRGVSKQWYSLGFHLGFTTDELNNLVSTVDVNCDPAVYLSKVLFNWLQRANPPTLEALCRALSHERIGEKKLALQLLHSMFNHSLTFGSLSLLNLSIILINTLVRIKQLCSFCPTVHRTETTGTERSKPVGANAISDIPAPAKTERKKLAANFNGESKASFVVSYCVSFLTCFVLFCFAVSYSNTYYPHYE